MNGFLETGWALFPKETAVKAWCAAAFRLAKSQVLAPEEQHWLRCEGTWFVGVDTLPNDCEGQVEGSGPLTGAALDAAEALYGRLPLHRGQVSVIYPGYPRPREGESDAAFAYRRSRDAAHVDGLLAEGPQKRRYLKERHAYILGLPLTQTGPGASPLTVWEGSHKIMQAAFAKALANVPQESWDQVDLTDIYKATRREVFETCPRREVFAEPGEAYLIHRHALHGVAPWQEGANAPEEGRMIAYFRPEWPSRATQWLEAP